MPSQNLPPFITTNICHMQQCGGLSWQRDRERRYVRLLLVCVFLSSWPLCILVSLPCDIRFNPMPVLFSILCGYPSGEQS